jgi:hypothetical protein
MPSVDLTSPREYSSPATMLSSWVYRSSKPRNQLQHFEARVAASILPSQLLVGRGPQPGTPKIRK